MNTSHWHDGILDVPAVTVYCESMRFPVGVVIIPPVMETPRDDRQRIDGMISPEPACVTLHVYRTVSDSAAVFPTTFTDDANDSKLLHALIIV